MSAFIALKYADRVELMADGAVYSDDGTLLDIRRKIEIGCNCAVATRGNADGGRTFGQLVCALTDVFGFDAGIERIQNHLLGRAGEEPAFGFEFVVCGISEARGPVILYGTTNQYDEAVPAWQIFDAGDELAGGGRLSTLPS